MVFVLYFMSIPAFDKKSAPRMRSCVQFSASNTRALILLIFPVLTSSDSFRFLNSTTSEVANEPTSDNVLSLLSFACLAMPDKLFLLIRVAVE